MISRTDTKLAKLVAIAPSEQAAIVGRALFAGERINLAFTDSGMSVIFTSLRVIVVLPFGMTGKKRDLTSIPFSTISAFATETNEARDEVSAITLLTRDLGMLTFELRTPISFGQFNDLIGSLIVR